MYYLSVSCVSVYIYACARRTLPRIYLYIRAFFFALPRPVHRSGETEGSTKLETTTTTKQINRRERKKKKKKLQRRIMERRKYVTRVTRQTSKFIVDMSAIHTVFFYIWRGYEIIDTLYRMYRVYIHTPQSLLCISY